MIRRGQGDFRAPVKRRLRDAHVVGRDDDRDPSVFARRHRSQTCWSSGLPAIEMERLARETRRAPARRNDAERLKSPWRRMISAASREIARDPIGAAQSCRLRSISGLHEDRSHAGVASALDVDRLVADKERPRKIELVIALRFEDHSGRWFSPRRIRVRQVGTEIGRVDQAVADLPQKLPARPRDNPLR